MAVHQEGLQAALETYYGGASSKPATLYVLLVTDTSIAATASLADLTEVSGSGYGRQSLTNNTDNVTSAAADTDDWKVTLDTVTFTATGDWTTAAMWALATSSDNSGTLLASGALTGGAVTLGNGETHDVPIVIKGVG